MVSKTVEDDIRKLLKM